MAISGRERPRIRFLRPWVNRGKRKDRSVIGPGPRCSRSTGYDMPGIPHVVIRGVDEVVTVAAVEITLPSGYTRNTTIPKG